MVEAEVEASMCKHEQGMKGNNKLTFLRHLFLEFFDQLTNNLNSPMCCDDQPKLITQVLHFLYLCKAANLVNVRELRHDLVLIVLVLLHEDSDVRLVQSHFSPDEIDQYWIRKLKKMIKMRVKVATNLSPLTSSIFMKRGNTGLRDVAMHGKYGQTSGIATVAGRCV